MRIAISTETNNGLDSQVAQHFGRCPFFAFVDLDGMDIQSIQVVDNPYYSGHQVGQVPTFIHEKKANVMLSGGMGGKAIQFFQQFGIEVTTGASGTVRSTLDDFFSGKLSGIVPCEESIEHHHDDE